MQDVLIFFSPSKFFFFSVNVACVTQLSAKLFALKKILFSFICSCQSSSGAFPREYVTLKDVERATVLQISPAVSVSLNCRLQPLPSLGLYCTLSSFFYLNNVVRDKSTARAHKNVKHNTEFLGRHLLI